MIEPRLLKRLLILAITQLMVVYSVGFLLSFIILKSQANVLSGLAGLALGLVYFQVIVVIEYLIAASITGVLMRGWHMKHPFMTSYGACLVIYVLTNGILGSGVRLSVPVALALTLAISFLAYYLCFYLFSAFKTVWPIVAVFSVSIILIYFGLIRINRQRFLQTAHDTAVTRGFEIYDTNPNNVNTEYLRYSSESLIPYSQSSISVSNYEIVVRQGAEDENLKRLLIVPDKCDYLAIESYISIKGKKDVVKPTNLSCRVVYRAADGRVILTPTDYTGISNQAPFIAKIGSTIIVFDAYNSSDDIAVARSKNLDLIIKFIKEARIITNDELKL